MVYMLDDKILITVDSKDFNCLLLQFSTLFVTVLRTCMFSYIAPIFSSDSYYGMYNREWPRADFPFFDV